MKPDPKRTKDWELKVCPAERACGVCVVFGENPEELRRAREMYTEGFPSWLVARTYSVPNAALRSHAWRHNWCRRRSYNLPDPKHLLTVMLLARIQDSWHLVDGGTTDRMLTLVGIVNVMDHSLT